MISCTFISPSNKTLENDLEGIFLDTVQGNLGILINHLPLVAQLKNNSIVRLKRKIGEINYLISSKNILHFKNNKALIITEDFSLKKEY